MGRYFFVIFPSKIQNPRVGMCGVRLCKEPLLSPKKVVVEMNRATDCPLQNVFDPSDQDKCIIPISFESILHIHFISSESFSISE